MFRFNWRFLRREMFLNVLWFSLVHYNVEKIIYFVFVFYFYSFRAVFIRWSIFLKMCGFFLFFGFEFSFWKYRKSRMLISSQHSASNDFIVFVGSIANFVFEIDFGAGVVIEAFFLDGCEIVKEKCRIFLCFKRYLQM